MSAFESLGAKTKKNRSLRQSSVRVPDRAITQWSLLTRTKLILKSCKPGKIKLPRQ